MRSTRWRAEAAIAVLFALVMVVAGGGAIWFVSTMSVHEDPASVGASTTYALGWTVSSVQLAGKAARMISHRGSPMGGTVSLLTFPDLGLAIAAAANVTHAAGVDPFALQVAEAFTRTSGTRE